MARFKLVLLIHGHQPVGNFGEVFERAYEKSYLPFVDLLLRHPILRAGMHYTGSLLEWIEGEHPEYFEKLRELVGRGQVEMIGGGFYEPILVAISEKDAKEQIERLADYLEKHFGKRPRGAWLAERVWEPQLPTVLAAAGVEYSLVDDNHFLGAGFEPRQLFGTYVAENRVAMVRLIPGLKTFRYLIPYREPEETVAFLRDAAREHPGGMAAMGDDLEKFGIWPGTYDHVYRHGWLERFVGALEANQEWLECAIPGDAVFGLPALGRADLPTCSYSEMMEWALPTPARQRFQAVEKEFASRQDVRAFLRGGYWRIFLTKYSEANLMQKKAMLVSKKLRKLERRAAREEGFRRRLEVAKTELLRAECNDSYWHGIFGGLYSPHLRTAVWRSLVRAEAMADAAAHKKKIFADAKRFDFDADGREEIYVTSDRSAALLVPHDGGTISMLDYRPAGATLVNSLTRRPEAYHSRLAQARTGEGDVASIHDQVRAKEPDLQRFLKYDRWARNSFRLLVFPAERSAVDYENLRLDEILAIAGGAYGVVGANASKIAMRVETPDTAWKTEKTFSFSGPDETFRVRCEVSLDYTGTATARMNVGLEFVANLLAPDAQDRYLQVAGNRHPLRWSGAAPASELRLVDEWQNVSLLISAPEAQEYWVAPIETISESEDGFERVYQGAQILAVWPVEFQPGAKWEGQASLTVSAAR